MKRLFLTSTIVVLVALLLSISLPIVPRSSYAQAPAPAQAAGVETPESASPEQLTRDNANPGVYFIDAGGVEFDPAVYPVDGAIRFYGWTALNPSANAYRWTDLDNYLAKRKAQGLKTGIMLTTYDGLTSGDIRSTPNFVIKKAGTTIPALTEDGDPSYANYWRRGAYNPGFDWSPSSYSWSFSGEASIVPDPQGASGNTAKLGGKVSSNASVAHSAERIPAMPPSLAGQLTAYVDFRVYIETADLSANDHLYVELYNSDGQLIGGLSKDINNLSHPANTWQTYRFDISSVAHEQSPRVTFRVVNDATGASTFYVDDVFLYVRHLIPNYESPTYFADYSTFIQALGDRYKANDDLEFVAIGTGLFGENQPAQYNFQEFTMSQGLTSADWLKYMKDVTSKYVSAFTIAGIPGPARSLLTQAAPVYYGRNIERKEITDFAAGLGVGISLNFLSPDWSYSYHRDYWGYYDPTNTWWRNVPIAYESYLMDLCNPVMTYYALANGLDKRVDYLRVDSALLKDSKGNPTANVPLYKWAQEYVGKSPQTTPRVFTIMSEHRNPMLANCRPGGIYYHDPSVNSIWPHLGNYNFFLRQVDGIPGGRTVPETNDKGADSRYARNPSTGAAWPEAGLGNCPVKSYREDLFGPNYPCNKTPYNPLLPPLVGQNVNDYRLFYNPDDWTGENKEAYVVRRTDQNADAAKNNPFMFFLIDNGYIDGKSTIKAKITVKYFDIGSDSWSLKYDSSTGEKVAGTVTKGNTRQLKTAVFTVEDARFSGKLTGTSDFYLDSRNPANNDLDGNEWVHSVEVEKLGAGTEPTTGTVEGVAFGDIDGDNAKDAEEPGLPGAVMTLNDPVTKQEKYSAESGADGKYKFENVAVGQYTLLQKTAPPQYLKHPVYGTSGVGISVQAGSTFTFDVGMARDPSIVLDEMRYLPMLLTP
jgi:hypothetical protein